MWKDPWDRNKWRQRKVQNSMYFTLPEYIWFVCICVRKHTHTHTQNNEKQLLVGEGTEVDGRYGESESFKATPF